MVNSHGEQGVTLWIENEKKNKWWKWEDKEGVHQRELGEKMKRHRAKNEYHCVELYIAQAPLTYLTSLFYNLSSGHLVFELILS